MKSNIRIGGIVRPNNYVTINEIGPESIIRLNSEEMEHLERTIVIDKICDNLGIQQFNNLDIATINELVLRGIS